ncbi:unnamed protein product [Rhizophagus irregularis]|nr:unnamed protein product [Rhizophagus irregularis]CAB5345812.1 unnamed protein product [Rhizophagus irregularis]
MHKSRLSLTKPFSLRKSANFSGRNILQKHKQFRSSLNADNKEGGETELQDEMDVESDNDDNNGEDDNGNGEEENNEDDDANNGDDDDANNGDDDDANNGDDDDANNEDEEEDDDHHIYGEENVYYDDDGDNVDEDEMEEDYDLGEDDSIVDDSSNVIFKFIHLLALMNEPPILDAAVFLIIEKVFTFSRDLTNKRMFH